MRRRPRHGPEPRSDPPDRIHLRPVSGKRYTRDVQLQTAQGIRLLLGGDRTGAAPFGPQLIERSGHRRLHALRDGRPALASLIAITVGQDRAFGKRRYWSRQIGIGGQFSVTMIDGMPSVTVIRRCIGRPCCSRSRMPARWTLPRRWASISCRASIWAGRNRWRASCPRGASAKVLELSAAAPAAATATSARSPSGR